MKRVKYLFILIITMFGCKVPYDPSSVSSPGSYLVVEGVINTGSDSTIIKLSQTVNVASATINNPVSSAKVIVEGDQNISIPLTETTNGNYISTGLNLDNTHKYRLSITTPDNQQYLSDFEPVSITPPIDSIGFKIQSNGVQIYVNTHDPTNTVKYYRWDYAETWKFHAEYNSDLVSNGTQLVFRSPAQQIYFCFASDVSSDIVLGSTAKLQQDVVYQNPVITIPSTSEKIETKYSVLLKEYALTGEAYNFWINLKTNTEQLGNIFDGQPSTNAGNIHNITNPSQPALGYISACTVQSKRIFIANDQLPNWLPTYPYTCEPDSVKNGIAIQQNLIQLPPQALVIYALLNGGYLATSYECADCTIRGTTKQPGFWK